ncbi:hypothetical protein, partial [Escherichia coli]|uniref:hypothetical protein n=1 Tax=Escherichia coli TaxID=562 RepID=UPI0034E438DB
MRAHDLGVGRERVTAQRIAALEHGFAQQFGMQHAGAHDGGRIAMRAAQEGSGTGHRSASAVGGGTAT